MISAAPNGIVPLQMEKTSALNEEMRRKTQDTSTHSEVLVIEKKGRSQKELKGGRDKSMSKSRSRYKNIECHYCHKIGHIQRNCFLWKKESKDKTGKQKEKDHDCNTPSRESVQYMVLQGCIRALNVI